MKKIFLPVVLLLVSACKEISFREPQPKGRKALTTIPKDLQGKYLTLTEKGEVSKDTVIITPRGYTFGYFDPGDRSVKNKSYEEGVLSDSLVLKSYKGYYFLNLNEDPEWLLRVLRQEKNGDIIYMTLEEKNIEFNDYLKSFRARYASTPQLLKRKHYSRSIRTESIDRPDQKSFFSETRLVKIRKK